MGNAWYAGTGVIPYNPNRGGPLPAYTAPVAATAPTAPVAVALDSAAYEAVLFGKDIPIFVGGRALMGGRIIGGPFYTPGGVGDQLYEYIAMHAMAANPSGTRTITEFRLRGEKVWTQAGGYLNTAKLPSGGFDWRPGSKTQTPFAKDVARYGAAASAYRWGIISSVSDVSLRAYNGIIGLPSVYIEDSTFGDPADGITRTNALETILRYMRLSDSEFEVDVTGSDEFWIIDQQTTLIQFLQKLRRVFVNWDITYTDKLRILEPTAFSVGWELDDSNTRNVRFNKTDPLLIPRQFELGFINTERDNEPDVAVAREDVYPVAHTTSVDTERVDIPIGMTSAQAVADAHVSLYEKLAVRSQMDADCSAPFWGMEAGDTIRYTRSPITYAGNIIETQHDYQSWTATIKAGEKLNCGVDCDAMPVDAEAYVDFTCPLYFVDAVEFQETDIIGGTGSSEIGSEGAHVDGENGWFPIATDELLAKISSLVAGAGVTIVIEFRAPATNNPILFIARDVPADNGFWVRTVSGATLAIVTSAVTDISSSEQVYTANAVNRVAISFVKDNTSSFLGKISISTNGVDTETTFSNQPMPDGVEVFDIGHWYELANSAAGYIRKIEVYELQDDADLPALSAV